MLPRPILVVDDDPTQLELMKLILNEEGFSVEGAGSGAQALELVPKLRPALILLDVVMPGMTGYEVLRRLWAMDELASTPVVMITGAHVPNPTGTVGFLRKPIDVEELLRTVRRVVRAGAPRRVSA